MFIDSHCHLDDATLLVRLPEVLAAGRAAGVEKYLIPGVSPDGWDGIARLAEAHAGVYPAFGLHPMCADRYDASLLPGLRSFTGRAVAIGEIGLDYQITEPSRDMQKIAFRAQLRLAVAAGLPVILHCRRAFQDLLMIFQEENGQRSSGVMHAFSGSPEVAADCIRLGLFIGVAGPVTYRNAVRPPAVVRDIPLEHLLIETDAPDLTPEPHRGKANEPAFLVEIAGKVAELKGISSAEVEQITTANAERLFKF